MAHMLLTPGMLTQNHLSDIFSFVMSFLFNFFKIITYDEPIFCGLVEVNLAKW